MVQYMCANGLRDGVSTRTTPGHAAVTPPSQCQHTGCNNDVPFGMQEHYNYYCTNMQAKKENKGSSMMCLPNVSTSSASAIVVLCDGTGNWLEGPVHFEVKTKSTSGRKKLASDIWHDSRVFHLPIQLCAV